MSLRDSWNKFVNDIQTEREKNKNVNQTWDVSPTGNDQNSLIVPKEEKSYDSGIISIKSDPVVQKAYEGDTSVSKQTNAQTQVKPTQYKSVEKTAQEEYTSSGTAMTDKYRDFMDRRNEVSDTASGNNPAGSSFDGIKGIDTNNLKEEPDTTAKNTIQAYNMRMQAQWDYEPVTVSSENVNQNNTWDVQPVTYENKIEPQTQSVGSTSQRYYKDAEYKTIYDKYTGRWYNIPTVYADQNGDVNRLSDSDAIKAYYATGIGLGEYNSYNEANDALKTQIKAVEEETKLQIEKAKAKENYNQINNISRNDIVDLTLKAQELANKDSWTAQDRELAGKILSEIGVSGTEIFTNPKSWWQKFSGNQSTNTKALMEGGLDYQTAANVYYNLTNKYNDKAYGFTMGMLEGSGVLPSVTTAVTGFAKLLGKDAVVKDFAKGFDEISKTEEFTQASAPVSTLMGNLAGAALYFETANAGISSTKLMTKLGKISPILKGMAGNAITLGGMSAINNSDDLILGKMSGEEYAKQTAINSGIGAVTGGLNGLTGVAVGKFMDKYKVPYNRFTATIISSLSSGTSYTTMQELYKALDKNAEKSSAEDVIEEMLIGMALGAISGFVSYQDPGKNVGFKSQTDSNGKKISYKWFTGNETEAELKAKYRKLAMQYHPDRGGDQAIFQEINNEYDALSRLFNVNNMSSAYTKAKEAKANGDAKTYATEMNNFTKAYEDFTTSMQTSPIYQSPEVNGVSIADATDLLSSIVNAISNIKFVPTQTSASTPTANSTTNPIGVKIKDSTSYLASSLPSNNYAITNAPQGEIDTQNTIIRANANTGDIDYITVDDFNGNPDPIITNITTLSRDANGNMVVVDNTPAETTVLTNKAAYVPDDYEGFDVAEAKAREEEIKSAPKTYGVSYNTQKMDNKAYRDSKLAEIEKAKTPSEPIAVEPTSVEQIVETSPTVVEPIAQQPTFVANEQIEMPLAEMQTLEDNIVNEPIEVRESTNVTEGTEQLQNLDNSQGINSIADTRTVSASNKYTNEVQRGSAGNNEQTQVAQPKEGYKQVKASSISQQLNDDIVDIADDDYVNSNESLKAIADENEKMGVKTIFFNGSLTDKNGIKGDSYTKEDGTVVAIQTGHPLYTEAQFNGHEVGHVKSIQSPTKWNPNGREAIEDGYTSKMYRALCNEYGQEDVDDAISRLSSAFEMAGINIQDGNLVEEFVNNVRGRMDVLHNLANTYRELGYDDFADYLDTGLRESDMTDTLLASEASLGEVQSNENVKSDGLFSRFSIQPPYDINSKKIDAWVESLSPKAKETYELFNNVRTIGNENPVSNIVLERPTKSDPTKKTVIENPTNIATRFMRANQWNYNMANNPDFRAVAKKIADAIPKTIRKGAGINADGSYNIGGLEERFKLERSLVQRLLDGLPTETVSSTIKDANGKDIKVADSDTITAVGGESYRRAILEENRNNYRNGNLKPTSLNTLKGDKWGAMGFLAPSGKTSATGDFNTVCPNVFFGNMGCFYCYRSEQLRSGMNNKLSGTNIWYVGDLLKLTKQDIKDMNKGGGLRIQSSGDWMPQFTTQLVDLISDAETIGLQIKFITKFPDLIETVARIKGQGIGKNVFFNLSADRAIEVIPDKTPKGVDRWNPDRPEMKIGEKFYGKRALSVEEAYEYRKKYPWVFVRTVAFNLKEFLSDLKDPRIQVVTGIHGGKTEYEDVSLDNGKTNKIIVEHIGDHGMPTFKLSNGKFIINHAGTNKIQKELANILKDDQALIGAYIGKSCCTTGNCKDCITSCGVISQDIGVKNVLNADTACKEYWVKNSGSKANSETYKIVQKDLKKIAKDSKFSYDLMPFDRNVGYHAGDLGKAEGYTNQFENGRNTGHFGTGTYFVGNKAEIENYNMRDGEKAPIEVVDFTKYNLYKPSTNSKAYKLHDALGILDSWYYSYKDIANQIEFLDEFDNNYGLTTFADIKDYDQRQEYYYDNIKQAIENANDILILNNEDPIVWEDYFDERDFDAFDKGIDKIQTFYDIPTDKAIDMMYQMMGDAINRLKSVVDNITSKDASRSSKVANVVGELFNGLEGRHTEKEIKDALKQTEDYIKETEKLSYEEKKYKDSPATVFMKALGYEGVDTRHLNFDNEGYRGLDNTGYGSVIYDLKDEDLARKNEIGTAKFSYDLTPTDETYMQSVEDQDLKKAQEIVDKRAEEQGYTVKGFHGTGNSFRVFDVDETSDNNNLGKGIYMSTSKEEATKYWNDDDFRDTYNQIDIAAYNNAEERIDREGNPTDDNDDNYFTEIYNQEYDKELARRKKEGRVIDLYAKIEKPFIISKDQTITEEEAQKLASLSWDQLSSGADWKSRIKSWRVYGDGKDGMMTTDIFANRLGHSGSMTEVLEKSGMYDGIIDYTVGEKFNSPADAHIIVFNANNVKDASPITYDRDGNIIPPSKRFDPYKSDMNFSYDLTKKVAPVQKNAQPLKDDIKELRKTNKVLTEQLAKAKKDMTLTPRGEETYTMASARKVVDSILSDYNNKLQPEEIQPLTEKFLRLANETLRNPDLDVNDYVQLLDIATDIARPIVKRASVLAENDETIFSNLYADIVKASDIYVSPEEKALFDDYDLFTKVNRGYIKFNNDASKGKTIDDFYADLMAKYDTEFFPDPEKNAMDARDKLERIVDVLKSARPVYTNPYDADSANAISAVANDILARSVGEGLNVQMTKADKWKLKVEGAKAEGKAELEKLRAEKNAKIEEIKAKSKADAKERLAKLKEKKNKQILALKQHYKDVQYRKKIRQEESKLNRQLLDMMNKLKSVKTTSANKQMIDAIIAPFDTVSASITGTTIERINDIMEFQAKWEQTHPGFKFVMPPAYTRLLERDGKTTIKELSVADRINLLETLKAIKTQIDNEKKFLKSNVSTDTFNAAMESIQDIESSSGKGTKKINFWIENTLSPDRVINMVTGHVKNSPLRILWHELAVEGNANVYRYQQEANALFDKFTNDKKFVKDTRGKDAKIMTVKAYDGKGNEVDVKVTVGTAMELAMERINQDNYSHAQSGGIKIPKLERLLKGDKFNAIAEGETYVFSKQQLDDIYTELAKNSQYKEFLDQVYNYFNKFSPYRINEVSELKEGFPLATVKDYFPIHSDKNYLGMKDFADYVGLGSLPGMSWKEERTANAKTPMYITDIWDEVERMIQQHSIYVGLEIQASNFRKVWAYSSETHAEEQPANRELMAVRETVDKKWGGDTSNLINRAYADALAYGFNSDILAKYLDNLRSSYAGSVLMFNAGVATTQAASYFTAAPIVGWTSLQRALMPGGNTADAETIKKYSPFQYYREKGFSDVEVGDVTSKGKQIPPFLNWIQGVDIATTRTLWRASEFYVRKQFPDLKVGTDEYYKKVGEIHTEVLTQTQPNYTAAQRPGFLRGKDSGTRALFMFKTQLFQQFGLLYDAAGEVNAETNRYKNAETESEKKIAKENLKEARKKATSAWISVILSSGMVAFIRYLRASLRGKDDQYRDEEGNKTNKSVAIGLGREFLSSMFGMVPLLSEAYTLATALIFKEKYYGIENNTLYALSDIINDAYSITNKTVNIAEGLKNNKDNDPENDAVINWENYGRALLDVGSTLGQLMGIPADNIAKIFKVAFKNIAPMVEGDLMGEYYYLRLTEQPTGGKSSPYIELLNRAYKEDPQVYKQLYEMYTNDILGSDITDKNIKSGLESLWKDEQGVKEVTELDNRYLTPENQSKYDQALNQLKRSPKYSKHLVYTKTNSDGEEITVDTSKQVEEDLYTLLNASADSKDSTVKSIKEKAEKSGLTTTQILEMQFYFDEVDSPNEEGNLGSYTVEELKQATNNFAKDNNLNRTEEAKLYLAFASSSAVKSIEKKATAVGITNEQVVIFDDYLEMFDKPNNNNQLGTYTNDETAKAIKKFVADNKLSSNQQYLMWIEFAGGTKEAKAKNYKKYF